MYQFSQGVFFVFFEQAFFKKFFRLWGSFLGLSWQNFCYGGQNCILRVQGYNLEQRFSRCNEFSTNFSRTLLEELFFGFFSEKVSVRLSKLESTCSDVIIEETCFFSKEKFIPMFDFKNLARNFSIFGGKVPSELLKQQFTCLEEK